MTSGKSPDCPDNRSVAVIGAGIAGISVAGQLARSGWHVSLYDAASGLCSGASGNAAGAFHAHVSRDDNPLSRLSRYGVDATLKSLNELSQRGFLSEGQDWACTGHLQIFDSEADAKRMKEALERQPFLNTDIRVLTVDEISRLAGSKPVRGGLHFRRAGWVKPALWGAAILDCAVQDARKTGGSLKVFFNTPIRRLQVESSACVQIELNDASRHAFSRVVIASALSSFELVSLPNAHMNGVKGQVSLVRMGQSLEPVISGAAYSIGLASGEWLIGATFDRDNLDDQVTEEGHAHNCGRLQQAFPSLLIGPVTGGRSALRAICPDRLPVIGPAIGSDGSSTPTVWFTTGFGSRGLSWAALAAEVIDADWGGKPAPLPQDLLAAVLPGRFFSRASNSKPTLPSLPRTR